jgi:hypothetical protein
MARTIRFHLDENCDRAIAEGLRRRGIDVSTTPEAELLSATAEEQFAGCHAHGFAWAWSHRIVSETDHHRQRIQIDS